jgi:hypothetical protein
MKTAAFHIVGDSPLLMHSTKGMLAPAGAKKMEAKKIPTPEAEAEAGAYRDEAGHLYVPCIFFRQAAVSAGKGRKIGKSFATTLLKGALIDPDRRAPLVNPETGEIIEDFNIDTRAAVVGKARIMRSRPKIEKWAADVLLDYDDEVISPDLIVEILTIAGTRVGVGDYRVEKGGWFGRFHVTGYSEA